MMSIKYLLLIFLLFLCAVLHAQNCTNLGQNPNTAFPVCGSTSFSQNSVAICGGRTVPTQCAGNIFQDKNPYWYKFTCFTAGTLGFVITPNNLNDDYDWQIFDVTGHDPNDVYTDKSLFVACNWSGESGKTGASAAGTSLVVCEGSGRPLFSSMPALLVGHNYLLLVSHFTPSQSGYSLSFGGGTASITDTTIGKLQAARINCAGNQVTVQLSKRMKCNSLAANGSDFKISPSTAAPSGAAGINCNNGFDMDSLVVTLNNPLPPGTYTIVSQLGSDGNTLLDNCSNAMPEGESASFTVLSLQPTPFDSITTPGCAPDELQLVFSKPLLCNSVAADGSDFSISPSAGATIVSAATTCNNGITNVIKLKLSSPIYKQGTHTVTLKPGADGNTVLDECSQQTLPGSTVRFMTVDTVSADFRYQVKYGCKADTIACTHNGANGITSWQWTYPAGTSAQQNISYFSKVFTPQTIRLLVSNGVCKDSSFATVVLDNELKANFSGLDIICPQDLAVFTDSSVGTIVRWNWDFANGNASTLKDPPAQTYPSTAANQAYTVRLIVENNHNCFDTATRKISVLNNCYIAVATAFTPNGDGLNDFLYPINAVKATNLMFRVYNRLGQLIFESTDFTKRWDGTVNGLPQPSGVYVWTLKYKHRDTGENFSLKGTSVLIR